MDGYLYALSTRIYLQHGGQDAPHDVAEFVDIDDYLLITSPEQDESESSAPEHNMKIAEEVNGALAADPKTASSVIEVLYDRGVITLTGTVDSEEAHAAAGEIAHRHEGVVSVVNALEVRAKAPLFDGVAHVAGDLLERAYMQFSHK